MMMTCRLLCALLVLALCCCPSVCVAEPPTVPSTKTTAEMSKDKKEPDAQANAGTTNLLTPAPVGKSPVADHSGSSGSGSGDVPGIVDEDGKSLTGMLAQSDDTNDNLQREVITARQGHKVARNHPRKKKLRKAKILPRQPRMQKRHRPRRPPQHKHQLLQPRPLPRQ
ncbi:mucin TcMUCII [Trypanosoma cruzi]|nr:mucin TcMUCII [Trypanosoma cruzi]